MMRPMSNKDQRVESLLFRAVLILSKLACKKSGVRLSNSELIAMQVALFEVLEELNDMQEKNAAGGAHGQA